MSNEADIRPFRVDMPDDAIADLRRRVAATRWPTMELVADRSQGVQSATTEELAPYWATDYDWRACEARLNALPQFTTEIDGVDIHFIHVRSPHVNALPLIRTQGWPGSVIELLETIGPLTSRPRTVGKQRRRSTSCCRPCPATASPASRPSSAGTSAASRWPGRN
jgi:epoxide hydrolase-like protein